MRIFNKEKNEELKEYNLDLGYLQEDVLITHHEEVKQVDEKGHYETIVEYPNGGKDVKWIVDVEGDEYQPAHDEEEKIYIFIPYTDKELQDRKRIKRIGKLKQFLFDTDYKAIKFAEGLISINDYEPIKNQREQWRKEINNLEQQLK